MQWLWVVWHWIGFEDQCRSIDQGFPTTQSRRSVGVHSCGQWWWVVEWWWCSSQTMLITPHQTNPSLSLAQGKVCVCVLGGRIIKRLWASPFKHPLLCISHGYYGFLHSILQNTLQHILQSISQNIWNKILVEISPDLSTLFILSLSPN